MRAVLGVMLLGAVALAQQPTTNYDEARVPPYRLPPLLVMSDGTPVRRAADWPARRAELLSLLESRMFGRAPAGTAPASCSTLDEGTALAGAAVRRQLAMTLAGRTVSVLVYLPANAPRPVPMFVGLGFLPNQSVHADAGIHAGGLWDRDRATGAIVLRPPAAAVRGSAASRWPVEAILARGYGLATAYYGDIEPDLDGAIRLGVRAAWLRPGEEAPAPDEWGAIAAWAWGLSRVADCLKGQPGIDPARLALVGHSRLGKTALWAGATDPRFALVISNESGEGGAAISRRRFGETVADLNRRFPHWFCRNYHEYGDREDEMPFDAHTLLALIAPRPLYVASAAGDQWADPKGEFLGAAAASEVYALLGTQGLGTAEMPPVDHPVGDTVRYHVRSGTHDITAYDWQQYLDFADRHFRR